MFIFDTFGRCLGRETNKYRGRKYIFLKFCLQNDIFICKALCVLHILHKTIPSHKFPVSYGMASFATTLECSLVPLHIFHPPTPSASHTSMHLSKGLWMRSNPPSVLLCVFVECFTWKFLYLSSNVEFFFFNHVMFATTYFL